MRNKMLLGVLSLSLLACTPNESKMDCDEVCEALQLASRGDKEGALKILEAPEYKENGVAQFQLALLYKDSNTVNAKAMDHYKASAGLGFPPAMVSYGAHLLRGNGIEKNPDLALTYFMKVLSSEKASEEDKRMVRNYILYYKQEMIEKTKNDKEILELKSALESSAKNFIKSAPGSRASIALLDENIFNGTMKVLKKVQLRSDSDIMGLMFNLKATAKDFFEKQSKVKTIMSKMDDASLGEFVATKKCFTSSNVEFECYHMGAFANK